MRITFFSGSMGAGGAERVISILANYYVKKSWVVDIVLLLRNTVDYELDERINIIDMTGKHASYKNNALFWLTGIRSYVKREKPDRIVSFVGRINALVLTAAMGLRVPVLVSERNDPRRDGRGWAMLRYCDVIYRRAAAVVFQTKYERSCFSKALAKKSYVIPNPVTVADVSDVVETPTEISTAGRLAPQKNHALLIDAVAIAREQIPGIQCKIYGEGSLRAELEEQIGRLDLQETVYLPGNQPDINRWVAKSGIFVMTSDFEGLSNALIEAMMLGRACITTDYPGADELIQNDVNGLVVPRGGVGALADALVRLAEDSKLRRRLGEQAKADAAAYSSAVVLKQWNDVIVNM